MTLFLMFFLELMTMRYAKFGNDHDHEHSHAPAGIPPAAHAEDYSSFDNNLKEQKAGDIEGSAGTNPNMRGEDHLGHQRDHVDHEAESKSDMTPRALVPEGYASQLTAVFILEFGVIFHSIFIGLTLAVSGEEFITLYIVLVFHQMFEGLGLGTRLAEVPWPASKRWTPYLLGLAYGLSTPIAIAIGLTCKKVLLAGHSRLSALWSLVLV